MLSVAYPDVAAARAAIVAGIDKEYPDESADTRAKAVAALTAVYDKSVHIALGEPRVHGQGTELLMVSFGNGVPMCLRVARRLSEAGVSSRVLDLRWLAPLPLAQVVREATTSKHVLVVDETRHSGGVAEAIVAGLVDARVSTPVARVNSVDSFVPLGPAADHVLLSETQIWDAARELLARSSAG